MFKKIKDNKYYQKFKEMRADPKLKPITSLIFWFIFLVVLVLFVRSISSPYKVVKMKTPLAYKKLHKDINRFNKENTESK